MHCPGPFPCFLSFPHEGAQRGPSFHSPLHPCTWTVWGLLGMHPGGMARLGPCSAGGPWPVTRALSEPSQFTSENKDINPPLPLVQCEPVNLAMGRSGR